MAFDKERVKEEVISIEKNFKKIINKLEKTGIEIIRKQDFEDYENKIPKNSFIAIHETYLLRVILQKIDKDFENKNQNNETTRQLILIYLSFRDPNGYKKNTSIINEISGGGKRRFELLNELIDNKIINKKQDKKNHKSNTYTFNIQCLDMAKYFEDLFKTDIDDLKFVHNMPKENIKQIRALSVLNLIQIGTDKNIVQRDLSHIECKLPISKVLYDIYPNIYDFLEKEYAVINNITLEKLHFITSLYQVAKRTHLLHLATDKKYREFNRETLDTDMDVINKIWEDVVNNKI